ncbi:hypothetical protein [Pontibacter rugosus]|uniref:Uncharacterized protein n=1 Tax=Pontibacter rugosus TaxID=1745966 RepID=A0ABW3SMU6_9BACT
MKAVNLIYKLPYLFIIGAICAMVFAIASDFENFMTGLQGKPEVSYKTGYLLGYNGYYLATLVVGLVLLYYVRKYRNLIHR